jgi:hypothetical protein
MLADPPSTLTPRHGLELNRALIRVSQIGDRMRRTETSVAVLPEEAAAGMPDAGHAQLVTIVSMAPDGSPRVMVDADGPVVTARLAVRTTLERVQLAIAEQHAAVVVFERGDRTRPLIVGFLERLDVATVPREPAVAAPVEPLPMPSLEADVDGRRVRLTAQDEIVLQCGSASVTLRRNGRVVIRGTYVETHSEGTNRIKGGQVQIN